MNNKNNTLFYLIIGLVVGAMLMYLFKTYKIEKREQNSASTEVSWKKNSNENSGNSYQRPSANSANSGNIAELTKEETVINYVKEHHALPECYITKSEARSQGWNPGESLCDAVPGKAIGGDHFSNRENKFPKGEQYFEADVNYECGHRNADRIVFTKNGEVWLTHDHYKSFEKQ